MCVHACGGREALLRRRSLCKFHHSRTHCQCLPAACARVLVFGVPGGASASFVPCTEQLLAFGLVLAMRMHCMVVLPKLTSPWGSAGVQNVPPGQVARSYSTCYTPLSLPYTRFTSCSTACPCAESRLCYAHRTHGPPPLPPRESSTPAATTTAVPATMAAGLAIRGGVLGVGVGVGTCRARRAPALRGPAPAPQAAEQRAGVRCAGIPELEVRVGFFGLRAGRLAGSLLRR